MTVPEREEVSFIRMHFLCIFQKEEYDPKCQCERGQHQIAHSEPEHFLVKITRKEGRQIERGDTT